MQKNEKQEKAPVDKLSLCQGSIFFVKIYLYLINIEVLTLQNVNTDC